MDQANPGFHAYSANAGFANCQSCHGAGLDGTGSSALSCAACHGATWKTNCTMCHGGTDTTTGAPPRATWGNLGDPVRVGTHTSHLQAAHGLSRPIQCSACHTIPSDALASGHVDAPTATVVFSGLAISGSVAPGWNRASATCSATYCHGATLAGGNQKSPMWTTTDGSQRACTSCHGAPPPDVFHARIDLACASCHPAGYSASAGTVAAETHVDGKLDYSGVTCTSCHGDATRAPATAAAPPAGTHGETATTTRAVGAHLQHLSAGTLHDGVACTECHAVPTSMVHADGTVKMTWGPLATKAGLAPVWNRATNTCSANWCHGGKLSGGRDTTPVWTTVNGSQDACGTCHGVPPRSGEHGEDEHRVSCGNCHGGTYSTTAADKSRHVDGILQVDGPRIRSWNPVTRRCQPTCHESEDWSG